MTARDDARSHPSLDELADLREGLLDNVDTTRVRDHVADCPDCTADLAALAEVAATLRDAGAEPVAMPASVARAIEDAISDASSARDTQPAPAQVAAPTKTRGRSRNGWVKPAFGWLAGAAAAAVIIGGIGAGLRGGDDSASTASGAADRGAQAESSGGGGTVAGPTSGKSEPTHVDERTVERFARALAEGRVSASAGDEVRPRPPSGGANDVGDCIFPQGIGGLERPVVWNGKLALLVVKRDVKVASVYSCDATPRRLYSTPY